MTDIHLAQLLSTNKDGMVLRFIPIGYEFQKNACQFCLKFRSL